MDHISFSRSATILYAQDSIDVVSMVVLDTGKAHGIGVGVEFSVYTMFTVNL